MDVLNIILILTAAVNLGLGLYIYFQRKQNPVNVSFVLLALSNFFWIIGMIGFRWSTEHLTALWWCRVLYFFPVFIALNFLLFTIAFRRQEKKSINQHRILLFLPALIVGVLVFIPKFVIVDVSIRRFGEKAIFFGNGYIIYCIYYFTYFSWAFFNLFFYLKKARFLVKKQTYWIILGTFLPVSFGLVTNLILPVGYIFKFNWFAQIISIIFVGGIAYAIAKYQLLNIKLVFAQIISTALIFVLFVNIFYFDNFWRLGLNIFVFFLSVIFSAILIRSVLREINQKEKTQKLASQLKEANKKLKKLDEVKSEFILIASHQLRTPLSSIKGYTAMLLEEIKDPERKDTLNKIFLSNERLIKLVNDLLNLSRIERSKLQFNFKERQLADILDSVVAEFQMLATRRGLKINYERINLPLLKIDEDKLRQVFINIIDNAIKYTLKGKITIKTYLDEDNVTIAISDTGVGMKQEDIDSIYEKFQRGKTGIDVYPSGTGIGLYIAHKILEAHNGRIWAESKGIDQGSTFYIKLPLPS
jgi:signal transduction histidine kinase